MKFSDKNTFNEKIEGENTNEVCTGKTWDEVEGKELEMISGMESFIGKSSQYISQKSRKIMKEWRAED